MGNTSLIRTALSVALIAAMGFVLTGKAPAAESPVPAGAARTPAINVIASEASSQFVPLGIGKSVVIDLPRDIKDVLVADPKIANAVVRSAHKFQAVPLAGLSTGSRHEFLQPSADAPRIGLVQRAHQMLAQPDGHPPVPKPHQPRQSRQYILGCLALRQTQSQV